MVAVADMMVAGEGVVAVVDTTGMAGAVAVAEEVTMEVAAAALATITEETIVEEDMKTGTIGEGDKTVGTIEDTTTRTIEEGGMTTEDRLLLLGLLPRWVASWVDVASYLR